VEQVDSNKPLSIALEEIATEKIVTSYPGDARRVAEELLGADDGQGAEVVSLGPAEAAEAPRDDAEAGTTDGETSA
jgi:hypothetical protein